MRRIIKHIIFFAVPLLYSITCLGQKNLSGTINIYTQVTGILSNNEISVSSTTGFNVKDTVMIVQMTGAENTNIFNYTGKYEYIAIQNITSNIITLYNNLINAYDPTEYIQLVRVPTYQNAIVTGKLTCPPWDSTTGTGGILTFFVNNSLTLNDTISADGKGFTGGDTTISNISCSLHATALNYTASARDSAGLKGMGIGLKNNPLLRGRGPNATGGGGGDDMYAGGGGGSNYGIGGHGAYMNCTATFADSTYGIEGWQTPQGFYGNEGYLINPIPSDTTYLNRIFMGGGGGGSNGSTLGSTTAGGNGGGIVFIIAHNITTNKFPISAKGASVKPTATDGAGGGGGGGYILLAYDSLKDTLHLSAIGGNGGSSQLNSSGAGGGGGGGFCWISGTKRPSDSIAIFSLLTLSSPGTTTGTHGNAFGGNTGGYNIYLNPVLNGFLFNQISISDTICCYNETPPLITGTTPKGGDGNYTYKWQLSTDTGKSYSYIAGASGIYYQPSPLKVPTFYRRVVTVAQILGSSKIISDTSHEIIINVVPQILNNTISPDTTICYKNKSITIKGSQPTLNGNAAKFGFIWETSQNGITWSNPIPGDTSISLSNTSNTDTLFYRRLATYSICSPYSDSVKITVLPLISHKSDTIISDQTICKGSSPILLTQQNGVPLSGGSGPGTYTFMWKCSKSNSNFQTMDSTNISFTPGDLNQTTYYYRVVYSGPNNNKTTCKDSSNIIRISVDSTITYNTLTALQSNICQYTVPPITGLQPEGGDSSYHYKWDIYSETWSPQPSDTFQNIGSAARDTGQIYYRRVVVSGPCTSTSNSIGIYVQTAIGHDSIGSDTTLCSNQQPSLLKPLPLNTKPTGGNGLYEYQWEMSTDGVSFQPIHGATDNSFQPSLLTETTEYFRKDSSGLCKNNTDTVVIKVLPSITGNILTNHYFKACLNALPDPIYSVSLQGGAGNNSYLYQWMDSVEGGTKWDTITKLDTMSVYRFPAPLSKTTYYRRVVTSGPNNCCIDHGDSTYKVQVIIPDTFTSPKKFLIDTFSLIYKILNNDWSPNDSSGKWVALGNDAIQFTPFDTTRTPTINNLNFGHNYVQWILTTSGVCPSDTITYDINIQNIVRYTGFSPNGQNPYFVIDGLYANPNVTSAQLTVFNRWGAIIYQNDHYDNQWNGNNMQGEPVPEDTYYYVLTIIVNNNDRFQYKGFVVLKR